MKTIIIVGHPNFKASRANKRLVEEAQKYQEITIHNLNEAYPDEKFDIELEKNLLSEHDRIVLQYPVYWYSMPALAKKWIEAVLQYGWAYGEGGTALHGKEFLASLTAGATKQSYQGGGSSHFSMNEFLKPVEQTAYYTGMTYLPAFKIFSSMTISDEDLETAAKEYVKCILTSKINE